MYLIDNLYYYLFVWFKKRQKKFKNSDPSERVSYGIGILIEIWFYTFILIIDHFIIKNLQSSIPIWFYILSGIFFMWLIDYIYTKKERLVIVLKMKKLFPDNLGIILSLSFSVLTTILPLLLIIIFQR
jgi:hypothetical protein